MITPYSRSQFVEKILTDCQGRQYRMLFLVALVDGEVKAHLLSAKPISLKVLAISGAQSDGCLCLPAWTDKQEIETPYAALFITEFISPYFSRAHFISSQPTRAPAYV